MRCCMGGGEFGLFRRLVFLLFLEISEETSLTVEVISPLPSREVIVAPTLTSSLE